MQLDEQAERQRAFDQQWKIRWDATNTDAVVAYAIQLEKRARRLRFDGGQEMQVEASLADIGRCVGGAAIRQLESPRRLYPSRLASRHVGRQRRRCLAWGWRLSGCGLIGNVSRREHAGVRRAERQFRSANNQMQKEQAEADPAARTSSVGGSQQLKGINQVRERHIEAQRKYRHLRRRKEAACRNSLRSELMQCENVREFFQLIPRQVRCRQ